MGIISNDKWLFLGKKNRDGGKMDNLIFLLLFILVFFPLILISFQRIQKVQKETNELLREIKNILSELSGKKESTL